DAAPVRAEQRAVVGGLDDRQLLHALVDDVGDGAQQAGALGRGRGGPSGERLPGGGDGRVHLFRAAAGDLAERAAVDRRLVGERGGGGDAGAADPVAGVDGDAGDRHGVGHDGVLLLGGVPTARRTCRT